MPESDESKFKSLIVPHFKSGFNLSRWLTRSDVDAADILQDASFKAFRFIGTLQTQNSRAWFLQIVRNTCYTFLKERKLFVELDLERELEDNNPSPEENFSANQTAQTLREALEDLDIPYREILILRELEELSYEEVSQTLQIPLGTVMSRLARARVLLKKKLSLKGDSR